ncbi:MAG: 30S ribosomal protein S4 [Bacteroidia bacterium]|nr:30S ribosomal protein S4 [Bacteroidia bacterium]MDW8159365.1 30S ribosomal protein S4 [Bacteroidia bacterium]
MARYTGPKQKLARRYREPLFGPSKAFDRKKYAPGQHGRMKRGKLSDYGVQLMEKQKAKIIYGMLERQFRLTFQRAARLKGSTGENLMMLLESRLDNVVYRMGFAPTRRAARQLVSHKHIMVNDRIVNIPSYLLKPGDEVSIRERSKSIECIQSCLQSRNNRYPWIEVDKANYSGKFLHYPEREQIPEPIKERLIVELYSR